MDERIKDRIKNNQKLILLSCGVILVLILLIIFIFLGFGRDQNGSGQSSATDVGNHEEDSQEVIESSQVHIPLTLENLSFLASYIGSKGSSAAINFLNDAILSYLPSSDTDSYSGTVAGKTVQKTISFPYDSISFVVDVSNDTAYYVQILLQKDVYYAMLVNPYPENPGNTAKLYVVFIKDASAGNYDRDEVISEFIDWAGSSTSSQFTLTTKNLAV